MASRRDDKACGFGLVLALSVVVTWGGLRSAAQAVDPYRGEDAAGRALIELRRAAGTAAAPEAMRPGHAEIPMLRGLPPDGVSIGRVDTHRFPLVYVYVYAYQSGQPVLGLPQESFSAYEWGLRQTQDFQVTGGERTPLDMVFLLDSSGSMGGKIDEVRAAIGDFVQQLEDLQVDARFGLVRFGSVDDPNSPEPYVMNNGQFITDVGQFLQLLGTFTASGGEERSIQAVIEACDQFQFREGVQRHFLAATDEDSDGGDLDVAVACCNDKAIHVHCAVDCNFGDTEAQFCDLSTGLAERTDGVLISVTDPLDEVLETILLQTSGAYRVRYRAFDLTASCAARPCKIKIDDPQIGGEANYTYSLVAAPVVTLTLDTRFKMAKGVTPNKAVTLSFGVVSCGVEVDEVTLHVRSQGDSSGYSRVKCHPLGKFVWACDVPAEIVGATGCEFFISVKHKGQGMTWPAVDPEGRPYRLNVYPSGGFVHRPAAFALAQQDHDVAVGVLQWGPMIHHGRVLYRVTQNYQWLQSDLATSTVLAPSLFQLNCTSYIPGDELVEGEVEYYFELVGPEGQWRLPVTDVYRVPIVASDLAKEVEETYDALTNAVRATVEYYADRLAYYRMAEQTSGRAEAVAFSIDMLRLVTTPDDDLGAFRYHYLAPESAGSLAHFSRGVHATLGRMDAYRQYFRPDEKLMSLAVSDFRTAQRTAQLQDLARILEESEGRQEATLDAWRAWYRYKLMNDLKLKEGELVGVQSVLGRMARAYEEARETVARLPDAPGVTETMRYLRLQRRTAEAASAHPAGQYRFGLTTADPRHPGTLLSGMLEVGALGPCVRAVAAGYSDFADGKPRRLHVTAALLAGQGVVVVATANASAVLAIAQVAYLGIDLGRTLIDPANDLPLLAGVTLNDAERLAVRVEMMHQAFIHDVEQLAWLNADTLTAGLPLVLQTPGTAPVSGAFNISVDQYSVPNTVFIPTGVDAAPATVSVRARNNAPDAWPVQLAVYAVPALRADAASLATEVPVLFTTSPVVSVEPGQTVTLAAQAQLVASSWCDATGYQLFAEVRAGPEHSLALTPTWCYCGERSGAAQLNAFSPAWRASSGEPLALGDGQCYVATYVPTTGTTFVQVTSADDAYDLHVYDAVGNHTGPNYLTSDFDQGIKGIKPIVSTGPQRVYRIVEARNRTFQFAVFARDPAARDSFTLGAWETSDAAPAVIMCTPDVLYFSTQDTLVELWDGAQAVRAALRVREALGRLGTDVTAVSGPLRASGSVAGIAADHVRLERPIGRVLAGETKEGDVLIELPPALAAGTYTGTLSLTTAAQSVPVTLVLDVPVGYSHTSAPPPPDNDNSSSGDTADADGDGIGDDGDNCRQSANAEQADADGDGVGDACDNCREVANADQADGDHDGIGDACEEAPPSDDSALNQPETPAACGSPACGSVGLTLLVLAAARAVRLGRRR